MGSGNSFFRHVWHCLLSTQERGGHRGGGIVWRPSHKLVQGIAGGPQCVSGLLFVCFVCVCVCNARSAPLSLKRVFYENFLLPPSRASRL